MLLIHIYKNHELPAYQQIRQRIAALVENGALRCGDRVPSSRELAVAIGVHRSTVVRAYAELRALGYLESRAGSYTTVRRRSRSPAVVASDVTGPRLVDWRAAASWPARALRPLASAEAATAAAPRGTIDFARLAADPTLAPGADLRRSLKNVIVRLRGAALDYVDPRGWGPLREILAARMRAHGIASAPDDIIVTAGAQHGLDLVLRLLSGPGDLVAVEAPTYGMAHELLRLHGVTPLEIPMREDGLDLAALEHRLRRRSPKLLYTMPNFHNPTGVTTDQAHRERLLAICEQHRVPIIEDGFEEEMKYFGRAVLPIKSMDARGIVLYVGTLSKVVFPGLRIGWIAAPREAASQLAAVLHASCLSGNTLAQAAAAHFCAGTGFEDHLRRIHRVYRRRLQALLLGLESHLPAGMRWTPPNGGYTVWLTLPLAASEEPRLLACAARQRVKVSPGSLYFRRQPDRLHLRLSIACVDEAQIDEGCRRLGLACRSLVRRSGGKHRVRRR